MVLSATGLSPHTRGKQGASEATADDFGPIPAYAGETPKNVNRFVLTGAYPRIRGGNGAGATAQQLSQGLSPHTRGKRQRFGVLAAATGPIPAYAGETRANR